LLLCLDRDDSFHGYPRDLNDAAYRFKIHVRVVDVDRLGWSAIITRQALTDEDEAINRAQMGNFFDMKKQLDASDPLVVAINRSKISTLTDQGYAAGLAAAVLKTFDYDLPLAQSWYCG
jgi:hypothetical protein